MITIETEEVARSRSERAERLKKKQAAWAASAAKPERNGGVKGFTVERHGVSQTFIAGADFTPGITFAGSGYIEGRWNLSGVEKIIALGFWTRERRADHKFKYECPSVEKMQELAISLAAEKPPQEASPAMPSAAEKTIAAIPPAAPALAFAAAMQASAPPKPTPPAAMTPEQVAAKTNGTKDAVGGGWDDIIAKMNAETTKGRR